MAQSACAHFRNIAADYGRDLLTRDDLRSKLQEVRATATASGSSPLVESAEEMVAGATTDDDARLAAGVTRFGELCDRFEDD